MRAKKMLSVLAATMVGVLLMAGQARAGFNVYVVLTAGGSDIAGETTVDSVGDEEVLDHLECVAVEHEIYGSGDPRAGGLTVGAYKLVKRVDKSSPLLARALTRNETITATLKFFRRNADTGETERFYTVTLSNARIASIRNWQPSSLDPAGAVLPFMEEIQIEVGQIRWTDEINSQEHEFENTRGGV